MIWNRLEKLKIDPFFYCFRWVTLLFAQDFALFDTLRIWESIFSSQHRLKFISYLAISIIISCRQVILTEEFAVVLEHLQTIQDHLNVQKVVQTASELYLEFGDKEFSHHANQTKKILAQKNEESEEPQRGQKGFFGKITSFMSEYFWLFADVYVNLEGWGRFVRTDRDGGLKKKRWLKSSKMKTTTQCKRFWTWSIKEAKLTT